MARIGTKKIRHNGNSINVPIFEPSDLDTPFFRTKVDGKTGAIPFKPLTDNPELDFLRTYHNGNKKGLHHSTIARKGIIDNFEDNDLVEYFGETSNASISTANVYEGSYSLKLDIPDTVSPQIFSTSGLPRYPQAGDTFEYWWRAGNASSWGSMLFGVQDETNFYQIQLRADDDVATVYRIDSGSYTTISQTSVTLSEDTWYRIEVAWAEGGSMTATVYDTGGTSLASTSTTDATYTGGGVGWAADIGGGGTGGVWFDSAEITATTSGTGVIDDFEDNDLSEYSIVRTDASVDVLTQSGTVYEGSYALEISDPNNTGENCGVLSTDGLDRYPQAGDTFSYWTYLPTTDSTNFNTLEFGVQDQSKNSNATIDNGYRFDISPSNDNIRLGEYDGGSFTELDSNSNVTWSNHVGEWLEVVVGWGKGGNITVTVYDSTGTEIVSTSGNSTLYSGGAIGVSNFSSPTGSDGAIYYDLAQITASGDQTATGTVDDFEDNNISEYTQNGGTWNVQTGTVESGSYALQGEDGFGYLHSGSGLDRYPRAGDTFQFRVKFLNSANIDTLHSFGMTADRSDGYIISLLDKNNEFRLGKRSGGTQTDLANDTTVSYTTGVWYRVKIEWGASGNITATLYDESDTVLANLTATDTEHDRDGITWEVNDQSGGVASVYFDNHEII